MIGREIRRVQKGLRPTNYKPMPSSGKGVTEIRIKDNRGIFRVIYIAKYSNTVHILHAFQKKTQRTEKKDIELARDRLKEI